MSNERHLYWSDCCNVRDSGGLLGADGRVVKPGAFVRSDSLERLNSAGWKALRSFGIRTIIDLRNNNERTTYDAND